MLREKSRSSFIHTEKPPSEKETEDVTCLCMGYKALKSHRHKGFLSETFKMNLIKMHKRIPTRHESVKCWEPTSLKPEPQESSPFCERITTKWREGALLGFRVGHKEAQTRY